MISIHYEILRIQGVHHFNQSAELFGNLRIQDGDSACAARRFRGGDVKACFSINDSINQVVIHGDSVVLQIYIVFGQPGTLSHTQSRTEQYDHNW